ncbi:MAG: NADH-quinone oxidoreductase subunit L [Sphingobacteriaceae bacterium]|nr:NADH-quinone oxidoreductase subunit L [Cytophagaceae bacterium]
MTPALLFWLLLLLPFAGFFTLIFSGKKATSWAGPLACILTAAGLALSAWLVLGFFQKPLQQVSFDWFRVGETAFRFGFYLDSLTATMLLLVPGVALLVQVYSLGYLKDEPAKARYFAFLQLFTGAMLGLVVTDNLLVLYGFWELVGLASYLLIGFWYRRPAAVQAAKKAFLINRIGDVCLLLGVFGVFRETSGFSLATSHYSLSTITSLLLFGGAVGKSAQFPLHTWLPDAMEGPTPVSALLHAATMVVAGIFLLGRLHPAFALEALTVVAVVGAISTMLGAVYALSQTDIKKVLAYSTISQLGLMVLGMGVGARDAALFHLLTHAAFKAGLFLAAGSVIHALHHEQNMARMGGLRKKLPLTFAAYAVCAAALAGVPLTSGFFSKDALVSAAFSWAATQANPLAWLIPAAALGSAALTAAYLTRQAALVFFGKFRGSAETLNHAQEPPPSMGLPVMLLAVFSLGWVVWLNPFAVDEVPLWVEIGAGIATLSGVAGAWFRRSRAAIPLSTLDVFYEKIATNPVLRLSALARQTDRRVVDRAVDAFGVAGVVAAHVIGWLDRVGVDGLVNLAARLAGTIGQLTRRSQGGQVQGYVVAALLGLGLVLGWLLIQ